MIIRSQNLQNSNMCIRDKSCVMKMDDMPMPKEMKKMMMKKMKGFKKKSDMMKKCMGHMEELVKINKQILAELKKLNKKK